MHQRNKHRRQLIFCVIWYSPLCREVNIAFMSSWCSLHFPPLFLAPETPPASGICIRVLLCIFDCHRGTSIPMPEANKCTVLARMPYLMTIIWLQSSCRTMTRKAHKILHHIASHTNTLQISKAIPQHMHTLQKQVRSPSTWVATNFIVVVKQVTWQTLYPRQNKNTILHRC